MAALKRVLSEAEDKAAKEHTEREKQEAWVNEVQQELQALMENMRVWSVTRRLESPSLHRLLRVPKPLRPRPKRPSRNFRRPRR